MRTIRTKVYQFRELSEQAKEQAISNLYKSNQREVKVIKNAVVMTGIITRPTPAGANIYLPINQAGSYFDSIYWLPFEKFTPTNEYEFTKDGELFHK